MLMSFGALLHLNLKKKNQRKQFQKWAHEKGCQQWLLAALCISIEISNSFNIYLKITHVNLMKESWVNQRFRLDQCISMPTLRAIQCFQGHLSPDKSTWYHCNTVWVTVKMKQPCLKNSYWCYWDLFAELHETQIVFPWSLHQLNLIFFALTHVDFSLTPTQQE